MQKIISYRLSILALLCVFLLTNGTKASFGGESLASADRTTAKSVSTRTFVNLPLSSLSSEENSNAKFKDDYQRGRFLLSRGDFDDALEAYRGALHLNFDNEDLAREFQALRKAIEYREKLRTEKDEDNRKLLAHFLLQYYRRNDIHVEHIELALKTYKRSRTRETAVYAIDAMIRAEYFEEALYFVDTLNWPEELLKLEKATIHLAADSPKQARAIMRTVSVPKFCDSSDLFRLAKLQAASGLHATAVKTLVTCFEQTPENLLARTKKTARETSEFDEIRLSPEFAEALKTKTKISPDSPPCSRKWIGVKIDETPEYLKNLSTPDIRFSDWKIN